MPETQAVADPLASLPLSSSIFSDELTLPDDFLNFDEDFDITFDDIHLPSDTEDFFNSTFKPSNPIDLSSSDPEFNDFVSDPETVVAESGNLSGNQGSDVFGFLNIPSPDNSGKGFNEETVRALDSLSPESRNENPVSSQGSGNCGSAGSDAAMNCPSPDSGNSVVDQKVKRESGSNFVLKRKKETSDGNSESRTIKYQRSNGTSTTTENSNEPDGKDEKKKARLIRNRESAQLSRQRKKHYVEELEDKVRAMHSTIQDLNARITYFAAENATLRQQMVGGGGGGGGVMCSPPVMYPPHPSMPPMGYPWMHCAPYVVKSQGSQVPLVPIPRLKPQQPPSSQKSKKVEAKGTPTSNTKTKKVASISFLGLFLFIVLFGGLVPIMNVKFGGVTDSYPSSPSSPSSISNDYKFYNQQHPGRVLMGGDDHINGTNRIGSEHNASEPLVASLYVPRNDKLVKIDGNLIIHSVLASEKAMASRVEEEEQQETTKKEDDTGLAVALDLVPAISIPTMGIKPHMYRTSNKENLKSKTTDGKLQQWFREGLAGPMLSSGMCTEVFQFDVSAGAIVPVVNITTATGEEDRHNSTYITTVKNRRILHGLPIPISNITKEEVGGGDPKHKERRPENSSMVVSVLFDPREGGDGGDVEGMMGAKKSFSRIFVVVLLDSVKEKETICPTLGHVTVLIIIHIQVTG